jgi:hypothetical protein
MAVDTTEAKKKLQEINETILTLDPAIRLQAFEILAPLYFNVLPRKQEHVGQKGADKKEKAQPELFSGEDASEFFGGFDHKKPKDNVLLIAAWLYSQFGVFPITRANIMDLAASAGLIVPPRSDNTMRSAKHNGKTLFQQKGKAWQLTLTGEQYMKEQYSILKGNKQFVSEEEA